jgi:argininosuccinate lyase
VPHDPPAPAPELIEAGFALETADAAILHNGLNLADLAHVLELRARGVIPEEAAVALLSVLRAIDEQPAEDFPYDPQFGEVYNARERVLAGKLGDIAGWLHAGRPRREATRIAFRLFLRRQVTDLVDDVAELATALAGQAGRHAEALFPDQTYLQQAQPSTVGHYLLAFAYPLLRDGDRLVESLDWINRSPAGAGCVNGTRLLTDREPLAARLGFDDVITHTRDAMWQTDGLVHLLAAAASVACTADELAEDLEIWASSEFDYVDLDDAYTRASVLMPQKRNPYALSMIRGAAGILIGRLTGFLALQKGPSARSDKLIYAYGEVPRALDMLQRVTRLTRGVVATLRFNTARMREQVDQGFSQATDLAEYVMAESGLDYRSAYRVVGTAVRRAAAEGRRGRDIDPALLDEAAGRPLGLDAGALARAIDPAAIVASRTAVGGASVDRVHEMVAEVGARAAALREGAAARRRAFDDAEATLRREAANPR